MRRELVAGLTVLLSSCASSSWPDASFPELPDDSRLGTFVAEGSQGQETGMATAWHADGFYVAVVAQEGLSPQLRPAPASLRVFKIDPATSAVSPLPSPPGTFKPPLRLPVVLDGAGVLLVAEGPPLRLLFYAAGGWTELPTPPDGFAGAVLTAVVARSASEVVLFTDTGATRFDGKSWQALALGPGASGVTPGPWDDSGLRLVFARGQNLTTVRYDVRTGQPLEAELALPNPDLRLPMGRALNGSSVDFQFLTTGFRLPTRVYRFHQGRFEPGALAGTGVLLDTPGSPIAVMLRGDGSIDRLTFGPFVTLQGGVVLAETTAVPTQLTCTCDRPVSLACGCDPRKVATEARPSPAADALGVVFFDDADGRRRLFFRRIPLPFTRSPFEESAP